MFAGSGSVTLNGGAGGGLFAGGTAGGNVLVGGMAQSTLLGEGDGDVLYAEGATADVLSAGSGAETLVGTNSRAGNSFFAGSGADQIFGGSGDDAIVAGSGAATMSGGGGANLFVFVNGRGGGADRIADFDPTRDTIALQNFGAGAASTALSGAVSGASGLMLRLSDGTQITLAGISSLSATSFV